MRAILLATCAVLLVGCLKADPLETARVEEGTLDAIADADPWGDATRQEILASGGRITEIDWCGNPIEWNRNQGRVLSGTDHLEIRVRIDPTFTGVQIGAALDDGDIRWTPVVWNGEADHTLDVAPDETEAAQGGTRWAFYHRMNNPVDPQDCYLGGGTGEWSLEVHAVRGDPGSA